MKIALGMLFTSLRMESEKHNYNKNNTLTTLINNITTYYSKFQHQNRRVALHTHIHIHLDNIEDILLLR